MFLRSCYIVFFSPKEERASFGVLKQYSMDRRRKSICC